MSCVNYHMSFDGLSETEWTSILLSFKDASLYQTWAYGEIRWGKKCLQHAVLRKDGEVVAAAQVIIRKMPLISSGIAYITWGPLWRTYRNTHDIEYLRLILKEMKKEYVQRRGHFLRVATNVSEEKGTLVSGILNAVGFKESNKIQAYRSLILDLTPPLEEIRKKLQQKWRNQLNRAEKNDLSVIEGYSSEMYRCFLSLQGEMLKRKKFVPGVNYKEFGEIQRMLTDPIKMKILVCEHNGEAIASAVFSGIGETGIYLLGASSRKGLELKASYVLQWRAIEWLKIKGCSWYDLGGINPDANPGVYHFKSGLSGHEIRHLPNYESSGSIIGALQALSARKISNFICMIKSQLR